MDTSTESLWRDFHDRLLAFVRSRIGDQGAADDILQQAFLRMHQSLTSGTIPGDPSGWVFAITRNAIADHYRAAGARAAAEGKQGNLSVVEITNDKNVAQELACCVAPLLDGLPETYRNALRWTSLEGLTQEEAARKAGVSLSGMKSRVQRGRQKFRDLIEACCEIELDVRGKPMNYESKGNGCPACDED